MLQSPFCSATAHLAVRSSSSTVLGNCLCTIAPLWHLQLPKNLITQFCNYLHATTTHGSIGPYEAAKGNTGGGVKHRSGSWTNTHTATSQPMNTQVFLQFRVCQWKVLGAGALLLPHAALYQHWDIFGWYFVSRSPTPRKLFLLYIPAG